MADAVDTGSPGNGGDGSSIDLTDVGIGEQIVDKQAPSGEGASDITAGAPAAAPSPETLLGTPAQAYPTAEEIARANYQTFGPLFQQMAPKPQAPEMPWKDPAQYWNMPQENAQAAFHERVTKYAEHIAEARTRPLEQRIQQLEGAFQYAQARFATDPNFSKIEARFQQLVYDGVPPHHARKYAELEMGQASPSSASPTTPRPVPMPPRHATTQPTRALAPQAPVRDRSRMPSIEESFKRSGAGRFMGE